MRAGEARAELARLRRALRGALAPDAQYDVAAAIAALGTPQAYRFLVEEAAGLGWTAEACRAALYEAGRAAEPFVLARLRHEPNSVELLACLGRPLSREAAEELLSICRRTTNARFIRWAVQLLAADLPAELPKLHRVLAGRRDRRLLGAFEIGVIAAGPDRFLERLKGYLSADSDKELQELALTVREGLRPEEAQALLRQWLGSRLISRRVVALRTIGYGRLDEFAGEALRAWVFDPSPSVRYWAWWAMVTVQEGLGEHVPGACKEAAGRLIEAERRLRALLVPGSRWSSEALAPARKALAAAVESVKRAYVASQIAGEGHAVMAGVVGALHRGVVQVGHGLAVLCEEAKVAEDLAPLAEDLLDLELGLVRDMWALGVAEARLQGLELAGHCTVALHDRSPEPPPLPKGLDWHGLIAMLRSACRRLYRRREALRHFRPQPEDALTQWPLVAVCAARMAILRLVLLAPKLGGDVEGRVLHALEHSSRREEQARRRLYQQVTREAVALRQTAYNDLPLTLLHGHLWMLGESMARSAEGRETQADASGIFVEQLLQEALLGILSQVLSARSVPLLIACLSSARVVVAECAERLLVRLGEEALPELVDALKKAEAPALQARLLEVSRCIEARAVLEPARAALGSDDALLCAVAVKAIGCAGERADAPAVRARFGQLGELVDVCILQALGELAPEDHWVLFVEGMGSMYPGSAWAAAQALARCSADVMAKAHGWLRRSANWFHREAAEKLFDNQGRLRPPKWAFVGKAFPVGGDAVLGAKIASRGPYPWQWGIPVLLEWGDVRPDLYASLITSDEVLARQWRRYTVDGSLADDFLLRLREIFLSDEVPGAHAALLCLGEVLGRGVRPYIHAFLAYHGLQPDEQTEEKINLAFAVALKVCTPERVDSLVPPNPSASNTLSDPFAIPVSENASRRFGSAFTLLLMEMLPIALGVEETAPPAPRGTPEWLQWVEAEWEALRPYQDLFYGFFVKPRLSLADLVAYCRHQQARQDVRDEMVAYLVASVTVCLQLPEVWEEARAALRALFSPIVNATVNRLCTGAGLDKDEARAEAEAEFERAVDEYDVFWGERPAAHLPSGTIQAMASRRHASNLGPPTGSVPTRWVPFAHYLERRMERLVRRAQATLAREAKTTPDSLVDSSPDLGSHQVGPAEGHVPTITLELDGEQVACVDIQTLAELTGKSVGALRQMERRGKIAFIRHKGRRYFPYERIEELVAEFVSDRHLEELLGVSRMTIARWRTDMPPGLLAVEVLRRLRDKAQAAKGKRDPKSQS